MSETRNIKIFDTTLRDGEQSPGIEFSVEDKVSIARELARLGVDVIEAGFPANNPDIGPTAAVAKEVGAACIDGVPPPIICALSRAEKPTDIELAANTISAAIHPRIHTFIATSEGHMRKKLKMTPNQVVDAVASGVALARTFTPDVEFSPEDASRSELGFMLKAVATAMDNGATTINIPDTTGWATPDGFGWLIRQVFEYAQTYHPDVVVSAHCHNDMGLAVANSMAAIQNGATQVEVSINGIGERAGNAALEEVVIALAVRPDVYGAQTAIATRRLRSVSKLVSKLSGYTVAYNKAVVGRNVHAHEAGIHAKGVLADPSTYEVIPDEMIACPTTIVSGKHQGRRGQQLIDESGEVSEEFSGAKISRL